MFNNIRTIWRKLIVPVSLNEVFTPNTAASLTYVHRDLVEDNFDKNFRIHGRQIILYGLSGSGKTTFLERYCEEHHVNRVSIHCDSNMTFEQLLLIAFDLLNPFYQDSQTNSKVHGLHVSNSLDLLNVKGSLENEINEERSNTTEFRRFLSPQLTPQRLAEELGKAGKILVVEDFHKLAEPDRKSIADMMKLFIDKANVFKDLKIICIGASDTARELIKLNSNIKHRVYECEMPLLSDLEIKQIIDKGCELLNIDMEETLVEKIIHYSNRLGTIAHQLCYDICDAEKIKKTAKRKVNLTSEHFIDAVKAYIDQHSDSFNEAFELAVNDPLGWDLLKTFSYYPHSPLTLRNIVKSVNSDAQRYSENQVAQKLAELSTERIGIIRSYSGGFRYSISDPFWGAFVKMRIATEQADIVIALKNRNSSKLLLENQNDIEAILLNILLNKYNPKEQPANYESNDKDHINDEFIVTLTIEGSTYENVEVIVSDPNKTIREQINSIVSVFVLPKKDRDNNPIQYQLGLVLDNHEEPIKLNFEDEEGKELTLLDYNVRPGDSLLLFSTL